VGDALELLGSSFMNAPDIVRKYAVRRLSIADDEVPHFSSNYI
jgi:hypothetical protein